MKGIALKLKHLAHKTGDFLSKHSVTLYSSLFLIVVFSCVWMDQKASHAKEINQIKNQNYLLSLELDEQGQSDLNSLVNAHLEGTEEDFDEVVSGIVPNSIELMWDALNGVDSSIDDLLTRARESIDVEEEL